MPSTRKGWHISGIARTPNASSSYARVDNSAPEGTAGRRGIRTFVFLLGLMVGVGAAATPACARKFPRDARPLSVLSTGAVRTDGLRYAVLETPPPGEGTGPLRLLDLARRTNRPVPTSECVPADGSHGRILLRCGTGNWRAQVITPRTGAMQELGVPAATIPARLGRYWMWGSRGDATLFGSSIYVQLGSGTVAIEPIGDTGSASPQRNLDDRDLPAFSPPLPRGTRWMGSDGPYSLTAQVKALRLLRGGGQVRNFRCAGACTTPSISAGVVSWTDGTSAYGYRIGARRLRRWRFRPRDTPRQPAGVVAYHTRYGMLVSVLADERADGVPIYRSYLLPLP